MIGRFIENQNTRLHHSNCGECCSALLATTECHNRLCGQIAADSELAEECAILFGRLARELGLQKLD